MILLALCVWCDGSSGSLFGSYGSVEAVDSNATDAIKKVHIVFMNHLGNYHYLFYFGFQSLFFVHCSSLTYSTSSYSFIGSLSSILSVAEKFRVYAVGTKTFNMH
jgi:hypothetical protein